MFKTVENLAKGGAEGRFREWALSSSEEAPFGGKRTERRKACLCLFRDVAAAGRRGDAEAGRLISELRLDLVTEQNAPVSDLVKLEPLNEP